VEVSGEVFCHSWRCSLLRRGTVEEVLIFRGKGKVLWGIFFFFFSQGFVGMDSKNF